MATGSRILRAGAMGMAVAGLLGGATAPAGTPQTYAEVRAIFEEPAHATYGEVPLWWWEGQPITKERATAQLERLASKGVMAVCPIQRSPARSDPASFEPEWWELLAHVNEECRRLGMSLWAYDQVGYGYYGWFELAAAAARDASVSRVIPALGEGAGGAAIEATLPAGTILTIRAYPLVDGVADDAASHDVTAKALTGDGKVSWTPPDDGPWRLLALVTVPHDAFYLSATAADRFIDMLYGEIARVLGAGSMGTSFAGVFQDEHPPTPRDLYSDALAERFETAHGYPITRAMPAVHFDVGPITPKYRIDFLDTYLALVEETYWKRVYDWTWERGLLTSHDNWGRMDINQQSRGYIDYFRSQRWFSAPGFDDWGTAPIRGRNYYDTKIAASIARLYGRPRVWNEAFHTSGWGRTTEQTLAWLTTGMAFGANLYNEHGLYYSVNASTWEHAAPDPHWLQPYWRYYGVLSDYVARTSALMSLGTHVADAAVHYPVVSVLAGAAPGAPEWDANKYMRLSRAVYDAGIDNDIIDDDSILAATIVDGALVAGGNAYRALVFAGQPVVRRGVIERAHAFAEAGGVVLFHGRLPSDSVEAGRDDPALAALLAEMLGVDGTPSEETVHTHAGGGVCAFVPEDATRLPALISAYIERDFVPEAANVFMTHRRIGEVDVYLVQNVMEGRPNRLRARFRVDGVPEIWDPFTGAVHPVDAFERQGDGYTTVEQLIEGNTACLFVFRPGEDQTGRAGMGNQEPGREEAIEGSWSFAAIPTRDNRWGEFRWPPSDTLIGPEVRTVRYREEPAGASPDWHDPALDDSDWEAFLYSTGPYWLTLEADTEAEDIAETALADIGAIVEGSALEGAVWETVSFSQQIGLAKAAPWGGHAGYPDGHIDRNFIDLPEGQRLLFTRLHAPEARRYGLRVELRNSAPRLWVNGVEQPFEFAVGNLPLEAGENTVLLALPDGGRGQLFVQATAPGVTTLAEARDLAVTPDIGSAQWIWSGDSHHCYTRLSFHLDTVPEQARIDTSAFSGYRLFVNGTRIEEEIGPWSNWRQPGSFTITPHLREGENVIAIWGQLFAGQNVNIGQEAFESRGIVAAMALRFADGTQRSWVTDGEWRGTTEEQPGWASPGFDDANWSPVAVRGAMGDAPWGLEVVHNVGRMTEPRRPLSVELASPYLDSFDETPEIVYDIKPADATRVGWFRFEVPPGTSRIALPEDATFAAWVNGHPQPVSSNQVIVASEMTTGTSLVALRATMHPGKYAGAVFDEPIALAFGEAGVIEPGPWTDYALPTYAGIVEYGRQVEFKEEDLTGSVHLDLGEVRVAAEVFVNGNSAGVRLAAPFRFDLTPHLHAGKNRLVVHVANTIAPHYNTIPALDQGATKSGLLGPVRLIYRTETR